LIISPQQLQLDLQVRFSIFSNNIDAFKGKRETTIKKTSVYEEQMGLNTNLQPLPENTKI